MDQVMNVSVGEVRLKKLCFNFDPMTTPNTISRQLAEQLATLLLDNRRRIRVEMQISPQRILVAQEPIQPVDPPNRQRTC